MEVELLKALPGGGSLVACVALVIYFLRHQRDMQQLFAEKIESAVAALSEEHAASREAFQAQITRLTDQVLVVIRETAVAVRGLEDAVRELQQKINGGGPRAL